MKSFASALTIATAYGTVLNQVEVDFMRHVSNYNLMLGTVEEYNFRLEQYENAENAINELNALYAPETTFGHNEFSHWSAHELKKRNGYVASETLDGEMHDETLPAASSVDWRQKGAVTGVKNQKQCGSCWAFSTTGAVEGMHQITTGKLISLSEQELVDCDYYSGGCNGGNFSRAFDYIHNKEGLTTESDYPYTAKTGSCHKSEIKVVANDGGHVSVSKDSDSALASAITKNPVSVAVDASSNYWNNYSGGVMTNASACGTSTDHAVLAVGYTSSYWIVKNSWGTSWGDKGYVYMSRQNAGSKGMCAILSGPAYPKH